MYDVVCIGKAAVDDFYRVAKLPQDDEKVFASHVGPILGGLTFNTARALRRLQDHVLFVTPLGSDDNSILVRQGFEDLDLSTKILYDERFASYATLVMVAESGEKAILLFDTDANQDAIAAKFADLEPEDTQVVFTALTIPALAYLEKYGGATPIVTSVEVGTMESYPQAIEWAKKNAHTMVLDRYSFQRMFDEKVTEAHLHDAAQTAGLSMENLIVTLGARGTIAYSASQQAVTFVESFEVDVVDPTGAGDIFNAAFLHSYYLQKLPLAEALRFSNAIAGASCEEFGPDLSPDAIRKAESWLSRTDHDTKEEV
jgi:sugar/nucleoside kinase (ribokinase family)